MSLMECRGATSQSCSVEHVGIPTLAALRQAVDALEDMDMKRGTVQRSFILGGIRTGADVKALALGAGAVSIGQGVLIALGCNGDGWVNESSVHIAAEEDYLALDTALGYCNHCHAGNTRLESLPRILFWNVTSYPK